MNDQEYSAFFSGKVLYGDDFSPEQIEQWYADEAEAYFELNNCPKQNNNYVYHELNKLAGYRYLPDHAISHALGIGSAFGNEFIPIIDRINQITILESSEGFRSGSVHDTEAHYVEPNSSGTLPFADETFDYAQSFGVLHHIPNVSFVLREISRCLTPGAYFLLREPIVSMGDWRTSRKGLTKRERGIPLEWLLKTVSDNGFEVVNTRLCMFPPLLILINDLYTSSFFTKLDFLICRMLRKKRIYHPKSIIQKLQPTSAFLVLKKIGEQ